MELVIERKLGILGGLMVLLVTGTVAAELKFGDRVRGDEKALLVEFLGTDTPVIVSNGYLFVDYEYVSAPYRIQRIGQGVVVNETLVNGMYRGKISWTNTTQVSTSAVSDPHLPAGITETNVHYNGIAGKYLQEKKCYLYSQYPLAEAKNRMIAVIESLPFTQKTELVAPDFLVVHHKNGVHDVAFFLGATDWRASTWPSTPEDLRRAMEISVADLKNRLLGPRSQTIFLSSSLTNRPLVLLSAHWMASEFSHAMDVVFSERAEKDKVLAIRELKLQGIDTDEIAMKFIANCLKSEALRERVKAMPAQNPGGTTPNSTQSP